MIDPASPILRAKGEILKIVEEAILGIDSSASTNDGALYTLGRLSGMQELRKRFLGLGETPQPKPSVKIVGESGNRRGAQ